MEYFDSLAEIVEAVPLEAYSAFETAARQRLKRRDEKDWPILAAALALDCPIWTEGTDCFGSSLHLSRLAFRHLSLTKSESLSENSIIQIKNNSKFI